MENPIKMDDLGVPIIFGNTLMFCSLKLWMRETCGPQNNFPRPMGSDGHISLWQWNLSSSSSLKATATFHHPEAHLEPRKFFSGTSIGRQLASGDWNGSSYRQLRSQAALGVPQRRRLARLGKWWHLLLFNKDGMNETNEIPGVLFSCHVWKDFKKHFFSVQYIPWQCIQRGQIDYF